MINGLAPHLPSPKPNFRTNRRNRFGTRLLARAMNLAGKRWSARAIKQAGDDGAATILTRSDTELGLEQIVDGLRIGFAAGRLHHLADEPLDRRRLDFNLGNLVRIASYDVVDRLFNGAQVGDLSHAARLDQRARVATPRPDDLE